MCVCLLVTVKFKERKKRESYSKIENKLRVGGNSARRGKILNFDKTSGTEKGGIVQWVCTKCADPTPVRYRRECQTDIFELMMTIKKLKDELILEINLPSCIPYCFLLN